MSATSKHLIKKSALTRRSPLIAALAVLALVIVACGDGETEQADDTAAEQPADEPAGEPEEADQEPVEEPAEPVELASYTVQIGSGDYSPSFFSYYVAIEQGYYEEEGIDFNIQPGPGSGNAIQQLIAGNVDYALATGSAGMSAVAEGFDIRWVQGHWYGPQFNVVVPDDSPITSFDELEGMRIGVPEMGGTELLIVEAAAAYRGWGSQDYTLTVVGEGPTAIRAFETDQIDALAINLPNELQYEQLLGFDLVRITPQEVFFFGSTLTTTPENLEDPEFYEHAKGIVKASIKGRLWCDANPDECYDVVKENWAQENLGDPGDDSFGRPYMEDTWGFTTPWDGDWSNYGYLEPEPGGPWGMAEFLYDLGRIDEPVDVSEVIYTELVDAAWAEIDEDEVRSHPARF